MFLPATRKEMEKLGWHRLDIILVTGDAYIDSPFIGVAVIGKFLAAAGFRVGIIAQPDIHSAKDITRLGEPKLFWGVSGGSIDSMVANRTASGRRRKRDDYTPGGKNIRRPDRAVLVYANLIRNHFKHTVPLVLGGIEASLRRIAHYDYWTNSIRKSILIDAKADYLLYGMAEYSALALAQCLQKKASPENLRGLCYLAPKAPESALLLPAFNEVKEEKNKKQFARMFMDFYLNNDPITAKMLAQQQDNRFLIQNPPWPAPTTEELDQIHGLGFEREVHPVDSAKGEVRAMETIRFALATHRGCYGECNFCAIAVHQGRTVSCRSRESLVAEAKELTLHPKFKGIISDLGGPTANMYGFECEKKLTKGACATKRCLFPTICPKMPIDHGAQITLLREIRKIKGIRKVVVASGIRYDMILADKKNGLSYLTEIVRHHVSGQLKIAPEHCMDSVLACMGKPGTRDLLRFRELFFILTKKAGLKQFLTYYIIAAHPGCRLQDMRELKKFTLQKLKLLPRQIQIFTPAPSTFSTLMYWTGSNPLTGRSCFVERSVQGREKQKGILSTKQSAIKRCRKGGKNNTHRTDNW
jgi:uncharacterized radical SAM protein YgiQ